MQQQVSNMKLKKFVQQHLDIILIFFVSIYLLAIFQDYLFSKFYITGFYLSESMLYNTYWLFFIPLIYIILKLYRKVNPNSNNSIIISQLIVSATTSILHILVFTSFFIFISNLLYENPHHFYGIFKSAISNQLFITLIIYAVLPVVILYFIKPEIRKDNSKRNYINSIMVKENNNISLKLDIKTVQSIETDRPYSKLITSNRNYLHSKSLKAFEKILDPSIFIRVHRTAIINKSNICSLQSRKNGDYDALMSNGHYVRLSRHYRKNWRQLINR